jgi:hypothetical protein
MIINTIMLLLLMFSKFENTSIFIKKEYGWMIFFKTFEFIEKYF